MDQPSRCFEGGTDCRTLEQITNHQTINASQNAFERQRKAAFCDSVFGGIAPDAQCVRQASSGRAQDTADFLGDAVAGFLIDIVDAVGAGRIELHLIVRVKGDGGDFLAVAFGAQKRDR